MYKHETRKLHKNNRFFFIIARFLHLYIVNFLSRTLKQLLLSAVKTK